MKNKSIKISISLAGLFALITGAAYANENDFYMNPYANNNDSGHFYVRGDGGVSFGKIDGIKDNAKMLEPSAHFRGNTKIASSLSDTNYLVGGAAGYKLGEVPIRLEAEFLHFGQQRYKSVFIDTPIITDFNSNVVFANLFYDFAHINKFTFYLGGGVGAAFNSAKTSFDNTSLAKKSSTNLAWNAGAGVAYQFSNHVSVDVGYRYISLGKTDMGKTTIKVPGERSSFDFTSKENNSHNILVGLTYSF